MRTDKEITDYVDAFVNEINIEITTRRAILEVLLDIRGLLSKLDVRI